MKKETLHAWYSAEFEAEHGFIYYRHENGEQVKVSTVATRKDCDFNWPDKVYVGIVTKWISSHLIEKE